MAVIFVAGIHGVGKTTGCMHVAQSLGVPHVTASQIIREGKASGIADVEKVVDNLDENQLVLVQGVQHHLFREKRLLLDGHFTLRTKEGIKPIPLRVFQSLSIRAVAVFTDDPVQIALRISERDDTTHHVDAIRSHQETEVAHAHRVSTALGIPIELVKAFDSSRLASLVAGWLNP